MSGLDRASLVVVVVTFVLFLLALFARGLTHDLLLEAGVFLVSVKLILMGYQNKATSDSILEELRRIEGVLIEKDCST